MRVEKELVDISNGYAISSDEFNIILHSAKVNSREGSKNFGQKYYQQVGYFPNLESLLKYITNKELLLSIDSSSSLNELLISYNNSIDKLYGEVYSLLNSK